MIFHILSIVLFNEVIILLIWSECRNDWLYQVCYSYNIHRWPTNQRYKHHYSKSTSKFNSKCPGYNEICSSSFHLEYNYVYRVILIPFIMYLHTLPVPNIIPTDRIVKTANDIPIANIPRRVKYPDSPIIILGKKYWKVFR